MIVLKRIDIIIIAAVILAAVISGAVVFYPKNNISTNAIVKISIKGKIYKTLSLNSVQTIDIKTDLGTNVVEINNGKVRIKESDCLNQICVKEGWIKKSGQSLVCLPHKVIVEIVSGKAESGPDSVSY